MTVSPRWRLRAPQLWAELLWRGWRCWCTSQRWSLAHLCEHTCPRQQWSQPLLDIILSRNILYLIWKLPVATISNIPPLNIHAAAPLRHPSLSRKPLIFAPIFVLFLPPAAAGVDEGVAGLETALVVSRVASDLYWLAIVWFLLHSKISRVWFAFSSCLGLFYNEIFYIKILSYPGLGFPDFP